MNSKFLIISLYALTVVLLSNYLFSGQKQKEALQKNDVILSIQDDTLTIPNLPKIEVINNTSTGFTLSPCKDIKITVDSTPLSDIAQAAPRFCHEMSVPAGSKNLLSFADLATSFAKLPGKYLITVSTPTGDRIVTFENALPGGFRTLLTTIFYNPIYNFFVALLTFLPGHSLGWAIVIITLIIRLILLVPQHHMLQSQKKLQLIQPKIKEIQAKYKDDQAKLGMEMLELYKKEGVNPMGSCLPLLIQMPILIGLYWVISGVNDPSNFYHLYSIFSGFNPTQIDPHFLGLNLQNVGGIIGLIFAVILGIFQYIQAKLSFSYNPPAKKEEKKLAEKKESETPEIALDPEMMQKTMLYMLPVMIAVSSYFFPLGVGLYWFIGTLFVIGQQWYVNKKKVK